MKIKIILVFVFLFFLFGFRQVYAGLVINEIMYAPENGSAYEWLEIFNNGNEQINLEGWRFFNNESDSSPLRTSGSYILEPSSYALITGNNSTISFSGQIFTSSQFSLPNDSNNANYNTYKGVYSNSDKSTGDSIIYDTNLGGGDNNSLAIIDGSWKSGMPTPGQQNQEAQTVTTSGNEETTSGGSTDTSSSSTSSSSSSSSSNETKTKTKTKVVENPTMKAKILANTTAFTGQPIELGASILGYSNENVVLGRIFWNFGDGETFEQVNRFDKFYHTYIYSGEYPVFLDYYSSSFSKTPDASAKIIIKVLSTTVSISRIGDAKDLFVELSNNAASDIDISNWQIRSGGKIFTLPKNSVILSKKKMTIPGRVNKLVSSDDLKLYSSTGELVYDYNNKYDPIEVLESEENSQVALADAPIKSNDKVAGKNLLASAEAALDTLPASEKSKNSSLFLIPLILLLILSGGAVYFIRKKKPTMEESDNFEIFDE